jgi:hypothetical protein
MSPTPDKPPTRQVRSKGPAVNKNGTPGAKRIAAAILEVLGGIRLPSDASTALGISLPRYYQLETRALNGLIEACEPRAKGRVRSVQSELSAAQREIATLKRDCSRQQALVRLTQRTVGLSAPQPPKPGPKGMRKRRTPTVRALKVVAMLKSAASGETDASAGGDRPAEG